MIRTAGLQHQAPETKPVLRPADELRHELRVSQARLKIKNVQLRQAQIALQESRNHAAYLQNLREEEKTRIAREIHDDLGSTLAAIKMETYWLAEELSANKDVVSLQKHADLMVQLADNASTSARRIISGLRPTILDDFGLLAAIEWQAAQFQQIVGIECRVNCVANDGCATELCKTRSINLFRIFQEALNNVAQHSGASRAEVEFLFSGREKGEIMLSISDNGCGRPDKRADAPASYGILGMTERVTQMGGKIKFSSPHDGGFCVTVTVPHTTDKEGATV